MRYLVPLLSAILLGVLPAPRAAAADAPVRYDVRMFGESAGALVSTPEGEHAFRHDFHYRSNGRGPTLVERIAIAPDGGFVRYAVTGHSTYGGAVDESFVLADGAARWKSTADAGDAPATTTPLYLPANGTPAAPDPATGAPRRGTTSRDGRHGHAEYRGRGHREPACRRARARERVPA